MMFPNKKTGRTAEPARRLLGFLLFLVFVFAFPQLLRCQNSTQPLRLTLKDTVALALRQNLDVQVANIDAAERQQDLNVSRSNLLPQASLQATEEMDCA